MKHLSVLLLLAGCKPAAIANDTAEPATAPADDTATSTEPTVPDSDIEVEIHDEVNTVLVVTWPQDADAELSWIEYSFEDTTMSTPPVSRSAGEQTEVLLGIPELTEVSLQIFSESGGETTASEVVTAETGALPGDLPTPTLIEYDPALASPEGWALISIDTAGPHSWYYGPYYVVILDRLGRIVWYYYLSDRRVAMYPHVALDGTHILFDESTAYFSSSDDPVIRRMTLDFSYNETVEVERYTYAYTELEEGGFIRDWGYAGTYRLVEQSEDGELRTIWDCDDWLQQNYDGNGICYTNTVNYSPVTNTVLWSLVYHDTVVEIDRDSGAVVRVMGKLSPTHQIIPATAMWDFQHYPNYTPDGTLLVSMHDDADPYEQRAREYVIDDEAGTISEIWSYGEGIDEYAYYSGEAYRLPNGNTLMNYGTGGAAREITPDKQVVWDIEFPAWYLTGHMSLVEDLYALNEGR